MPTPTCPRCGQELPDGARFCVGCGNALTTEPRSAVQRLRDHLGPDYDVMGEIGHGGFAVVYLVGDTKHARYLALKVMREAFMVSPTLVARFRREIDLASSLDHPSVVPVLFHGQRGDLVFYAMPRIKGHPLKRHLEQRHPLPIPEALVILRELAAGLAHAHSRKVIHRDVKPSNVMIEPSGRPVILDFGVAKGLAHEGGNLSISGELLGSPQYMSPEQAAGERNLDQRTDIYSWAVVGWEIFAGEPLFSGSSVREVMNKHLAAEPRPLTQLRPDTPGPVVALLERALRKDRTERWDTMEEALETLARV